MPHRSLHAPPPWVSIKTCSQGDAMGRRAPVGCLLIHDGLTRETHRWRSWSSMPDMTGSPSKAMGAWCGMDGWMDDVGGWLDGWMVGWLLGEIE